MVVVQLNTIQSGSLSNNVGVFSGQNVQNSWDSHSPTTASFGANLGDFSISACHVCWTFNRAIIGMPTFDHDTKGNQSRYSIGV